jgi:phosphatidate cytidylyltransferase
VAGRRDDRERGSEEDLFEDLDQFFAPLDESGWPEEGGEPSAPADRAAQSKVPPDDTADAEHVEADLDALEIDIPDEDELLGVDETEPEAAEEPPAGVEEEEEATDEQEPAAEGPSEEAGSEPAPASGEPLTVEDLKAAPPQYADLPGPSEDQPVLAEEATIESLDDLEGTPPAQEGTGEEPAAEEPTPPREEPADLPLGEAETGPEDEVATAEAAADHFAEGIPPEEVERELLADLDEPGPGTVQIDTEGAATAPEETVPEGELAPTWQEEGALPVVPEEEAEPEAERPAPAPAARNLTAAVISGVLLAAAVIALLLIGKGAFAVFASLIVLLGQAEFYAVLRARGFRPATLLGLVAGAFTLAGAYLQGDAALLIGVVMAMTLGALWYMAAPAPARKRLTVDAALTVLGVLYVPVLASFAILLLALPGTIGRNVFLTVLALTVLYDVGAYVVGSVWGNRALAPTISPRKSWEGAIGATFVILLVALAIVPSIEPFTASTSVGLALLIAVAAPLGDLVESAFKRDLGVKDMGTILPGHGGVLDRIDAVLFTAPVAYYFLRIVFL